MKRAIILLILLVISYAVVVVGMLRENEALWYTGIGFGCAVALAVILGIVKMVWRFMARSITSILFVLTSLVILGVLSWYGLISAFIGYAIGTVFGVVLFWLVFRKLANWAEKSMLFGEIFSFLTNYKIRSYLTKAGMVDKETKIIYNVDYRNIVLVLTKQLGYSAEEAEEAAQYAVSESEADKPIEHKIGEALKFLDGEYKTIYDASKN